MSKLAYKLEDVVSQWWPYGCQVSLNQLTDLPSKKRSTAWPGQFDAFLRSEADFPDLVATCRTQPVLVRCDVFQFTVWWIQIYCIRSSQICPFISLDCKVLCGTSRASKAAKWQAGCSKSCGWLFAYVSIDCTFLEENLWAYKFCGPQFETLLNCQFSMYKCMNKAYSFRFGFQDLSIVSFYSWLLHGWNQAHCTRSWQVKPERNGWNGNQPCCWGGWGGWFAASCCLASKRFFSF